MSESPKRELDFGCPSIASGLGECPEGPESCPNGMEFLRGKRPDSGLEPMEGNTIKNTPDDPCVEFTTGAKRQAKAGAAKGRCDLLPYRAVRVLNLAASVKEDLVFTLISEFATTKSKLILRSLCIELLRSLDGPDPDNPTGGIKTIAGLGLLKVAKVFEAGAAVYSPRNWEKGIPYSSFLDSGCRHYCLWRGGQTDEPHLAQAAWNFLCLLETMIRVQENSLPLALDDLPFHKALGAMQC